jgi:hypothetical protein
MPAVNSFKEFEAKYGGSSHALHGVGKASIYSKKGHLRRKRRRGRLPNVGKFSSLPMARKYRASVPAGFRTSGWHGNSQGHWEAKVYGMYGGAKIHQRKPKVHRGFSVRQSGGGFVIQPTVLNPTPVIQEPVVPPVTTEFGLNKPKHVILGAPVRGVEAGVSGLRGASAEYNKLRSEAIAKGATPLPTLREAGYSSKYVTPANVSFYATKTGRAIKGGLKFLEESKRKADLAKKEKLFNLAQERAEQARNARLELQTELEKKKLDELKKASGGIGEVASEVVSQEEVEKAQEKNRGVLGGLLAKKKVPVRESKEEIERDYASV